MRLQIRRWDPSTVKPHRITLIVGRRGTGKSVLQRDLMYHQSGKIDFGIAMSPTEEAIQSFREHMPDAWIYRQYQQDKVDDIINVQRKALKAGKTPKSLFLVLDDCMYDKRTLKSTAMRDIFMNGRHLRISLSLAAQYMMDLGPDLRTQIDYVVCTREMIIANRVKLWKYFYGMFERFDDYCKVMDKCTENYSTLVIDNTVGSSNIEDCIFWYRADPSPPPFRMGKQIYWTLSEQFSKTDHERALDEAQRAELERASQDGKKKKQPLVVQVADERGNVLSNVAAHRPPSTRIPL